MKQELRYALRHKALNCFGKRAKDLTHSEMKEVLNSILKEFLRMRSSKETKEEFISEFKLIFGKEIRHGKKM